MCIQSAHCCLSTKPLQIHHPQLPNWYVSLLMLTITYIQAMALDIHIQSRFNNHTACSLYRILVMETSVVGLMKIRNIVPRAGNKPTSLAFQYTTLKWLVCFVAVLPLCRWIKAVSGNNKSGNVNIPLESYRCQGIVENSEKLAFIHIVMCRQYCGIRIMY